MVASIALDTIHIRSVDPRRDLLMIADLIELCFADQMDEEGREYVRQIRRSAENGDFFRWMYGADERISLPLGGFVWVEDHKVIGNLTLIPFRPARNGAKLTRWRYLIANVAVHPDYRRRGIGRQLTLKALEHIRKRNADAWLQVREDNPPAINLYRSIGFIERSRRTTWDLSHRSSLPEVPDRLVVASRKDSDWPQQATWLRHTYPTDVSWNLGLHSKRLAPGFWRSVVNFFNDSPITHWSVRRNQCLIGVASWDPGPYRAENLWVATDPDNEEEALFALLVKARATLVTRHPLSINYPSGRGTIAFTEAGFVKQNTLIWMESKMT